MTENKTTRIHEFMNGMAENLNVEIMKMAWLKTRLTRKFMDLAWVKKHTYTRVHGTGAAEKKTTPNVACC